MKNQKIRILQTEDSQLKNPGNIFNKIIDKNILNFKKDMSITKHRKDQTRKESPSPHNSQNAKHTQQRKILNVARKKIQVNIKSYVLESYLTIQQRI